MPIDIERIFYNTITHHQINGGVAQSVRARDS